MTNLSFLSTETKRVLFVLMLVLTSAVLTFCAVNCWLDCVEIFGCTTPAGAYSAGLTPGEYIKSIGFLNYFVSAPLSAQRYLLWYGVACFASIILAFAAFITAVLSAVKGILDYSDNKDAFCN